MSSGIVDYYKVLGVSHAATPEEIRRAYLKRMSDLHPDKNPNVDPAVVKLVNLAHDTLRDPARKAAYDAQLRKQYRAGGLSLAPPATQAAAPARGNTGRTILYLAGGLVFTGAVAAGVITLLSRPPKPETPQELEAKVERTRAEAKLKIAEDEARHAAETALAKRKQEAAAVAVRLKATKGDIERALSLAPELRAEIDAWNSQVAPLLTNETGKKIAANEDAVIAFQKLWTAPLVSPSDVQASSERLMELLKPIDEELAKAEPLAPPSQWVTDQVSVEEKKLQSAILDLKTRRQQVQSLVAVAQRVGDESSVSLQQAMDQATVASLDRKNRELATIERETQDKLRELEVARKRIESESQIKLAESKVEDAKATGERNLANSKLLEQANSPSTKALLAFFLTPGYVQADKSQGTAKRPFSYSGLVAAGALENDEEGLTKLLRLLINQNDKVRPTWPSTSGKYHRDLTNEKKEKLQAMQRALAELGPALVELGLLDP